jgi:peptide/nickel transport system substrate-binding protein
VINSRRRDFLRVLGLCGASLLLGAACRTEPETTESGSVKDGTLRVSTLGGAPKVLHPYPEAQQHTSPHSDAMALISSSLIDVDYDSLTWVADPRRSLARALPTIAPDGLTFTFSLRDDIRWSDGKPISATDFQFAWANASQKQNNFVGLADLERIASYRAPDARTVEVTLKERLASFLALSIANAITPLPEHVWAGKAWSDPSANPEILRPTVVSGPFLPQELTAERHSYVRNPNWWGQPPKLDGISFVNATPQTILELLNTRQVEWAQNVPPAQVAQAKQASNLNVLEWVGAVGSYRVLIFNLQRPALADRRVREALVRTVDRNDLVQFEDNLAVPQYGVYTEGSPWRSDQVERYDPDPSRAQVLLEQAGYRLREGVLRNSDGEPLKLEIIWPTTSQPRGKVATYLQQQWKALGIEVTVTGLEFNAFTDKYQRQRDFDLAMGSYNATADPDSFKSQVITQGTQNASGYSNPRVDQLIQLGAAEQNDAQRKQLYDELQRLVVGDLPQYFMLTVKNVTALDKRVRGVSPRKGVDILRQNNLQVLDWELGG